MTEQYTMSPLTAAEDAVRAGMTVVAEWRRSGGDLGIRRVSETPGDEFVTAVDHASEEAIRAALHRATPGIPVVGELHAEAEVDDELVWVVDPVDGTTNLVNGDPFVSVTVALLESGQPIVGATGCPFTGELWSAMSGQGAHDSNGIILDIRARATSRTIALDPKTPSTSYAETWREAVKRLESAYFDVRPLASIALELAHVANGDFDGFVALGQPAGSSILDFAAGILLIREAGGDVIGLDGRSDAWTSEAVLAGNAETLERLRECMVDFKVRVPEA